MASDATDDRILSVQDAQRWGLTSRPPAVPPAPIAAYVHLHNTTALPFDQAVLELAFQGLANRNNARLYYIEPVFWTYVNATTWFADNWLAPQYGYEFTQLDGTCDVISVPRTARTRTAQARHARSPPRASAVRARLLEPPPH